LGTAYETFYAHKDNTLEHILKQLYDRYHKNVTVLDKETQLDNLYRNDGESMQSFCVRLMILIQETASLDPDNAQQRQDHIMRQKIKTNCSREAYKKLTKIRNEHSIYGGTISMDQMKHTVMTIENNSNYVHQAKLPNFQVFSMEANMAATAPPTYTRNIDRSRSRSRSRDDRRHLGRNTSQSPGRLDDWNRLRQRSVTPEGIQRQMTQKTPEFVRDKSAEFRSRSTTRGPTSNNPEGQNGFQTPLVENNEPMPEPGPAHYDQYHTRPQQQTQTQPQQQFIPQTQHQQQTTPQPQPQQQFIPQPQQQFIPQTQQQQQTTPQPQHQQQYIPQPQQQFIPQPQQQQIIPQPQQTQHQFIPQTQQNQYQQQQFKQPQTQNTGTIYPYITPHQRHYYSQQRKAFGQMDQVKPPQNTRSPYEHKQHSKILQQDVLLVPGVPFYQKMQFNERCLLCFNGPPHVVGNCPQMRATNQLQNLYQAQNQDKYGPRQNNYRPDYRQTNYRPDSRQSFRNDYRQLESYRPDAYQNQQNNYQRNYRPDQRQNYRQENSRMENFGKNNGQNYRSQYSNYDQRYGRQPQPRQNYGPINQPGYPRQQDNNTQQRTPSNPPTRRPENIESKTTQDLNTNSL
jgi:hypothetical protein